MKEMEKMEHLKKTELYKNTLDYQVQLKNVFPNLGAMTGVEKKMNKNDLHSFKHNTHSVHSMIPGISNIQSVGALPTFHKGLSTTNTNSPDKKEKTLSPVVERKKPSIFKTRHFSENAQTSSMSILPKPKPLTREDGKREQKRANLFNTYLAGAPVNNAMPKPHGPTRSERLAMTFENKVDYSHHNPLTNPVVYDGYNPYLNKEKQ